MVLDAGSENGRAAEAQKLLNYGFEAFDTLKLYAEGQPVHELPVWKGERQLLQAGFTDDYYVTIPKGSCGQAQGDHGKHATTDRTDPCRRPRGHAAS